MNTTSLKATRVQKRWKYLQTLLVLFFGALCSVARAHPMGNFSINHLSELTVHSDRIEGRYLLDFAEIPTVTERAVMDADGNGEITESEKTAYLARRTQEWGAGLKIKLENRPQNLTLKAQPLQFKPGAGNLPTLRVDMRFELPFAPNSRPQVSFEDRNFTARTGWKDVVVRAAAGAGVSNSDAPTSDQSKDLTQYPSDVVPPQRTEATFVVATADSTFAQNPSVASANLTPNSGAGTEKHTPHDAFHRSDFSGKTYAGHHVDWFGFGVWVWRFARALARTRQNNGGGVSSRTARHVASRGCAGHYRDGNAYARRFRIGCDYTSGFELHRARTLVSNVGRD